MDSDGQHSSDFSDGGGADGGVSQQPVVRSRFKCLYPRRVNADMLQCLPIVAYRGEIVLVEDDDMLDAVLPEILRERVLGFDTETRPNFSRNKHYLVSILQLCGAEKVWIIRLEPLKHRLSDIYEILENPAIKKVGLAVHGDILSLKERWLFSPAGFVDIAQSTKGIGVINTGMKNLAALVLGERISKSAQLTNWASDSLTKKQLEYAATDAWISRRLFLEVKKSIETTSIALEPEPKQKHRFNFKVFVSGMMHKLAEKFGGVKLRRQHVSAPKKSGANKQQPRNGGRRRSGKRNPQDGRNSGGKRG